MKSRYKIAILACLLIVCGSLEAQTFRIEAGYLQPTRESSLMSHRYFNGVRLGGTVGFDLPVKFLSAETGLFYSYTFSNDTQKALLGDSVTYKTQGHYLDIPLHLVASYDLFKNKFKVFAFAGPNFNIGLFQPQKVTATAGYTTLTGVESGKYDLFIKSDNENIDHTNRFNFQLELGGGIQWRKLFVRGGYSFGMNNLNKRDTGKQHQSGWFVNAGYEF